MKRCVICQYTDCRCGCDRYEEDDDAETATAPVPQPEPVVRPDTYRGDPATLYAGLLIGMTVGILLGAIAATAGR